MSDYCWRSLVIDVVVSCSSKQVVAGVSASSMSGQEPTITSERYCATWWSMAKSCFCNNFSFREVQQNDERPGRSEAVEADAFDELQRSAREAKTLQWCLQPNVANIFCREYLLRHIMRVDKLTWLRLHCIFWCTCLWPVAFLRLDTVIYVGLSGRWDAYSSRQVCEWTYFNDRPNS